MNLQMARERSPKPSTSHFSFQSARSSRSNWNKYFLGSLYLLPSFYPCSNITMWSSLGGSLSPYYLSSPSLLSTCSHTIRFIHARSMEYLVLVSTFSLVSFVLSSCSSRAKVELGFRGRFVWRYLWFFYCAFPAAQTDKSFMGHYIDAQWVPRSSPSTPSIWSSIRRGWYQLPPFFWGWPIFHT